MNWRTEICRSLFSNLNNQSWNEWMNVPSIWELSPTFKKCSGSYRWRITRATNWPKQKKSSILYKSWIKLYSFSIPCTNFRGNELQNRVAIFLPNPSLLIAASAVFKLVISTSTLQKTFHFFHNIVIQALSSNCELYCFFVIQCWPWRF